MTYFSNPSLPAPPKKTRLSNQELSLGCLHVSNGSYSVVSLLSSLFENQCKYPSVRPSVHARFAMTSCLHSVCHVGSTASHVTDREECLLSCLLACLSSYSCFMFPQYKKISTSSFTGCWVSYVISYRVISGDGDGDSGD